LVGDFADLAVLARRAVLIKCRDPSILRDFEDRAADRLGQLIADREPHVALPTVVNEITGERSATLSTM
jgi:hypothetical protein